MSDNVAALPQRGKTYFTGPNRVAPTVNGPSVALEGLRKRFSDLRYAGVGVKGQRSGGETHCVLVRNVSGFALAPKRLVKWAAGFRGKRVAGYARLDHDEVAGAVDEWLPASGVANNDLFWLARRGPATVLTDLAGGALNVINEGDTLTALTAATTGAVTAGRVQPAAITSSVTVAQQHERGKLGIAMSARTTANTGADLLAELTLSP